MICITYHSTSKLTQKARNLTTLPLVARTLYFRLPHSHINMLGRYQFNLPEELKDGALRPLRDVEAIDELADLDLW